MNVKNYFILIYIVFIVSNCSKDKFYEIENLNNNKIFVLGHAGMGEAFKYPANSWESIKPLFEIGANGSEIDIQMTKDKQLVLYHDNDLNEKTNQKGKVHSKNLNELKNCLYASPLSSSINLLSLESLFDKIQNRNPFISLDIKLNPDNNDTNYNIDFATEIKKLVEKYDLENVVMIESWNLDFLLILKTICPKIKLYIISRDIDNAIITCKNNNLYGISTDIKNINKEQVKIAHLNEKRVMLWNAKSIEDQKLAIKLNPDFIQSDKPISLLKELNYYKKTK